MGGIALLAAITWVFLIPMIVLCVILASRFRQIARLGAANYKGKAWKYKRKKPCASC